jgi:hypothetical protein
LGREYKDPASTLKYTVDFAADLGTATISGASGVAETGLTLGAVVNDTTTVTVTVSGGTVGETYRVTVTATTNDGQTLVRSFWVAVRTQ